MQNAYSVKVRFLAMSLLSNEQAPVVIDTAIMQAKFKASHSRPNSVFRICAGIFILAFAVRIGLLFATKSYLDREHSELVNVATSLANGRGFANPYGDTGPTAHMSPLYPLLLSIVYRWAGAGTPREIAQEIVSCFLGALTWGLIPLLGDICRLDRRVGVGAALMGSILTINRWAETKGSSEAAMASLAFLLVFILFMKSWYSQDFSSRASIVVGLFSGLAILVSASLGSAILGLLLAGYFVFHSVYARKYLCFSLVVIVLIIATSLPWALRNYFALGSLVWTRDNFPLELMVSNNDYSVATMDDNRTSGYMYHPFMSPEQRTAVKSMGEIAFEKKLKGEALDWIATHPKRFAYLTLQRICLFWFPQMKRPIQTLGLALLTVASAPALIFLFAKRQPIAYGLVAVFVTYPIVYYVVQSHPRYVYPIQWTLYLLASQSFLLAYLSWKGEQIAASDGTRFPRATENLTSR
jgi:hypothetical protein